VAVELTPSGCRALLGVPARALWNLSVEAGDVLGRAAAELRERLHERDGWSARFAACDDVLGRLLRPEPAVAPELHEAWRLVVGSGGSLPVADVASEVGWSRRQLARRFSDELGLSPKLASRVVRFERARRMLQLPARLSLAEVAASCGYYDQPHLNRDFAELAGCPPGEWLAAEVPSVQDAEAAEQSPSAA
jgi:AraC-like DNA-binding protein